ncbi:MAG: DUF4380 domain-containing protein [Bacteroidales bacterium]|nr:DUF4380 domain-containing protein [Bacteroidales bacterium]
MKRHLIVTAILLLGCTAAFAQKIKKIEESRYAVTSGDVVLTVDAARGGKIMSFSYNGKEVMSQMRFPNSFGGTFWTSPQKEWNWPPVAEFDTKPYEVYDYGESLVLKSQTNKKLGYSVMKEFSVDRKGAIVVKYTIVNESNEVRKVAPWEITRVPSEGVVAIDGPLSGITPGNGMEGLTFTSSDRLSWYVFDVEKVNRKVNADGRGWLAYANNGLLLLKKFQDIRPEAAAPGEAEIQVYVNAGKSFTELESQGEYTTLKPGQTLSWSVKWVLAPIDCDAAPSKTLAKTVRSLVARYR